MTAKTQKLAVFFVGMWAVHAWAQGNTNARLFPMPEVIRNNVEFWKKIYAVYPTKTVLIHDVEDMSVIYEVVNFSGEESANLSYREQSQKVEKIKDEYRAILRSLAKGNLELPASHPRVAKVIEIFGANADAARLERAAQNLRGQSGISDRFRQGLQRSGLYHESIDKIFAEYGLPEELIMLPHVESSFNYKAYSKVGAAGMWQFMRYTGRLFMTINYDVDERLDPIRSTEAAAKLLQLNYSELGSWPLAITAYNHGLNGMKRAKSQYGDDFGEIYQKYQSRSFGFASRNFYAQFLAALEVARNHQDYFGAVEFHRPEEFVEIELDHYVYVSSLLNDYGLELDEFSEFNPALRPPVIKSQRRIPKGYRLRLPKRLGADAYALAAKLDKSPQFEKQVESDWYQVQRGDNMQSIASRFKVSVNALAEYNNISRPSRIQPGLILKIPPQPTATLADANTAISTKTGETAPPAPTFAANTSPIVTTLPATATDVAMTEETKLSPPPLKNEELKAELMRIDATNEALLNTVVVEEQPISRAEREAIVTYDFEQDAEAETRASAGRLVGNVDGQALATANTTSVSKTLPPPPAPAAPTVSSDWIVVEPEETLGHYATWLEVPTQSLRAHNNLRAHQDIHIGQRIRLLFDQVSAADFEHRRYEYHRGIQEDFFSTYQVDSVQTYRIKRGQNIWQISNTIFQIPMWLMARYNADRDLTKLKPGDEISVPMVVAIDLAATPTLPE